MKSVTKIGIDALRNEFPVMTSKMMSLIMAGDNKYAVGAIYQAGSCAGYGYSMSAVEDCAIEHIMCSRNLSRQDAENHIAEYGLTNNETYSVMSSLFCGGINSGGATPGGSNLIIFDTGQKDSSGNAIHHAGTLNAVIGDDAVITDANGKSFIVPKSSLGLTVDVADAPDSGCGGGDDCGCGSGNGW